MRVTANGVELAIEEAGQGDPPFVFIHGLGCDRHAWQPQFDALSRTNRCLALDLRGCGESPAVPPFHLEQQAQDVAAVMDALGLSRAVVAGHSLGGVIALLLNDLRPDLVLGTVIGDAPVRDGAAVERAVAGSESALRESGSMEGLRTMIESFITEGLSPADASYVRNVMYATPPDVAAGMLSNIGPVAARMTELVRKADARPFMAIWAERPFGDPRWLRDTCVFVRQEPMAGCGHFFQLEQPAVTTALLRAFLDDIARDPRIHQP